jgi:hypothetical protein
MRMTCLRQVQMQRADRTQYDKYDVDHSMD